MWAEAIRILINRATPVDECGRRDASGFGRVPGIEGGQQIEEQIPKVFGTLGGQVLKIRCPAPQLWNVFRIERTSRNLFDLLMRDVAKWPVGTESAKFVNREIAMGSEHDLRTAYCSECLLNSFGDIAIRPAEHDHRGLIDRFLQLV